MGIRVSEGKYDFFNSLLDVTEEESVSALAEVLREKHNGVDIIISNAATRISPKINQSEQVATFINTNNHGTYRMIKAFVPLLRENDRFLIVASSFGSLRNLSPTLHDSFDVTDRSLEDIEHLMDNYAQLVETDQVAVSDWPEWINIPSKVAQVASMKIIAQEMQMIAKEKGIMINAVCPGLVDTAASRSWFDNMSSAQSLAQAAIDVVWLVTLSNTR